MNDACPYNQIIQIFWLHCQRYVFSIIISKLGSNISRLNVGPMHRAEDQPPPFPSFTAHLIPIYGGRGGGFKALPLDEFLSASERALSYEEAG